MMGSSVTELILVTLVFVSTAVIPARRLTSVYMAVATTVVMEPVTDKKPSTIAP
jgi:hypothetical protein